MDCMSYLSAANHLCMDISSAGIQQPSTNKLCQAILWGGCDIEFVFISEVLTTNLLFIKSQKQLSGYDTALDVKTSVDDQCGHN